MANPQPTGTGQRQGLEQLQKAGTPLPSRPERAVQHESESRVPCDHVEGHADARTDLSMNPWERF